MQLSYVAQHGYVYVSLFLNNQWDDTPTRDKYSCVPFSRIGLDTLYHVIYPSFYYTCVILRRVCMRAFSIVFEKGRWMKFIWSNDRKHNIDGSGPWVSWLIGSDTLAWA